MCIVYFRNGLYDNTKATPEQYVLAAAHVIDWSLRQHPGQINVAVIASTNNVDGGPNGPADMNFIKLFIQVLILLKRDTTRSTLSGSMFPT